MVGREFDPPQQPCYQQVTLTLTFCVYPQNIIQILSKMEAWQQILF